MAGVDPRREASLPREQEAEPRPADLLLEVRGLGRPSRPHFLQPRPTPCSPRVYGNSGLDGFSEIIRSLCPHLTPPAPRGTQARLPGRRREGREPFSGPPPPAPTPAQVWPLPQHFPFKFGFHGSDFPGSAFHLQGSSWEVGATVGYRVRRRKPEGHVTLLQHTQRGRVAAQPAPLACLAPQSRHHPRG